MNIVFLDSHALNPGDLSWKPFEEFGTLTTYPRSTSEEAVVRAQDADVILTNKVRLGEEEFAKLPRLRLILEAATGYDNIDVAAARRHGVTVCNVPAYSTLAVAQHAMALLLEVCNQVGHYSRKISIPAGESSGTDTSYWAVSPDFCCWDRPVTELTGKRIAIVGWGNIGSKVAQLLLPLEAEVVAVTSKPQEALPTDVKKVSLEEAFATSFAVSLHCPLSASNRAFVNRDLLSASRRGLILINTARGGLINDADVAQALADGQLAAYCTDVLSQEPPSADHPILHAPNVFITPHIAWASADARQRIIDIMTRNFQAFLRRRLGVHGAGKRRLDTVQCDAVICGSDQIWTKQDPPYYAAFETTARRIAYAPSIGNETFPPEMHPTICEWIKKFDFLSAREAYLAEYLHAIFGVPVPPVTLDPTLLLTSEDYRELMPSKASDQPFVFVYAVLNDDHMVALAEELAGRMNCRLIVLREMLRTDVRQKQDAEASPEKFLWYIRHAACVLTNSFHGTVFSLLFHTPFYGVYPEGGNTRIENLLEIAGLPERHVTEQLADTPISWPEVDARLEKAREPSLEFLFRSLY